MTSTAAVGAAQAAETRLRLPGAGSRAVLAPMGLGVVLLGAWELGVRLFDIDPFVVPAPTAIAGEVLDNLPTIWSGSVVTGRNALAGLLIGAVLGVLAALVASASHVLDQMAAPVVAALSVVPIVALAPVLYTMFGAAADTARVLVAALSVVVPVYLNTLRGLRQVLPVHRDLMRAYAARPTWIASAVTLPTAVPFVFTGLRIASSLAVISALIAEYFGGPIGGLGKSITSAAAGSDYALAWAYVFGSIVLGLAFYVATLAAELWFTRHRATT